MWSTKPRRALYRPWCWNGIDGVDAPRRHLGAKVAVPTDAWLVGEWRPSSERKYHLSNLPPDTSLRALAAAIKARWVCEQAHQQLTLGTSKGAPGRACTGRR